MVGVVLQSPLNPTDDVSWSYTYAHGQFKPHKTRKGTFMGIQLSVSPQSIELKLAPFPSNRILHNDDPSEFVLVTLEKIFRFEGHPGHVGTDYLKRFFASGVTLNGKRYRFYGHSNSQLRGRSCFFRRGNTDKELDERIYKLGSFEKIMNVAKRAKRIGLLFSGAEIDYDLDPRYVKDIPDIISNGEMFSDVH
ncbi:hypothetical protein FRC03_005941 [Tulasnella sp. 419]|nr:hypothetical protein FRC03_005941 [Tulasnella sp. 419]